MHHNPVHRQSPNSSYTVETKFHSLPGPEIFISKFRYSCNILFFQIDQYNQLHSFLAHWSITSQIIKLNSYNKDDFVLDFKAIKTEMWSNNAIIQHRRMPTTIQHINPTKSVRTCKIKVIHTLSDEGLGFTSFFFFLHESGFGAWKF